jgi:two-component system response regulator YesN
VPEVRELGMGAESMWTHETPSTTAAQGVKVELDPRSRRVLVVDDDLGFLEGIEMALTNPGQEVHAYASFEEARTALRTTAFDALLTDVRLGAFNGLQLALIARTDNPHIRIIVISGIDDPVLRDEAAAMGAEYLVKPVTAQLLQSVLDRAA